MTLYELAKGLKSLSKEQQKDFVRAIRVLRANGKINDKEYYDAINEALKSSELPTT